MFVMLIYQKRVINTSAFVKKKNKLKCKCSKVKCGGMAILSVIELLDSGLGCPDDL